jgi:two-component system response regulator AtoC
MTEALAASEGVQVRAAELLGMPIRTFSYKLKQYGISPTGRAGS